MHDETLRLIVKGRVQGVGFRWHVAEAAKGLDLAGWVKNREDGSVEILVGGSREALAELERLVGEGPAGAHVSVVERASTDAAGVLRRPFFISR